MHCSPLKTWGCDEIARLPPTLAHVASGAVGVGPSLDQRQEAPRVGASWANGWRVLLPGPGARELAALGFLEAGIGALDAQLA